MSFAFALDTDASTAFLDNGAADGETETCALYEVVEFDEAFEDAGLQVKGNARTRVFAIEIDAVAFFAIAHTDMSLLGIFHGIGDEVGEQLLQTACVKYGGESGVGIVFLEFDIR